MTILEQFQQEIWLHLLNSEEMPPMTLLFLFVGIFFVYLGLSTYFGRDKLWWLMKSTPVVPTGIVYGAFPAAMLFLVMAIIFRKPFPLETRLLVLDYVLTPLLLLSILFSMWQPRWLKTKMDPLAGNTSSPNFRSFARGSSQRGMEKMATACTNARRIGGMGGRSKT